MSFCAFAFPGLDTEWREEEEEEEGRQRPDQSHSDGLHLLRYY